MWIDSVPLRGGGVHMTARSSDTISSVSVFPQPVLRWRFVPPPDPAEARVLAAALNLPLPLVLAPSARHSGQHSGCVHTSHEQGIRMSRRPEQPRSWGLWALSISTGSPHTAQATVSLTTEPPDDDGCLVPEWPCRSSPPNTNLCSQLNWQR